MHKISLGAVLVAWLPLLASRALCQCPEPTESELESLTLAAFNLIFTEGTQPTSVELNDWNINCLAAASTRGYREAIVAVDFTTSTGSTQRGQLDISCSSETWGGAEILLGPGQIGRGMLTIEELLISETDVNCISCSPMFDSTPKLPSYCALCSPSCDAGLMQCYFNESNSQECCNFYDVSDNCVSECSTNQEPNGDYTCMCSGFFEPQGNCSVCNIIESNCTNGSPVMETCSCNCTGTGYSGLSCDQDIDECVQDSPCVNGSCNNSDGDFSCTCVPGYTGKTCDEDIDECAGDPCENGATCTDDINSYSCECVVGFSGTICEINEDDCNPNPCLNGGSCVDQVASYSCACPTGYSGSTCETDIDECLSGPCANGGLCSNGIGEFSCQCVGSWRGETCQECFIENCMTPVCDGDQSFCRQCDSRFTLVGDTMCVSCPDGNCASCSRDSVCSQCRDGYELTEEGGLCTLPPEPLLSGGELVGLVIGLLVGLLVLVIVVSLLVGLALVFLKKKNWYRPAKKDPGKQEKDIMLTKESYI